MIAASLGYEAASPDEAAAQFPVPVTFSLPALEGREPRCGDVRELDGRLELFWTPRQSGGEIGWYPVPTVDDIEDQALGEDAFTPAGDAVEPDHPDSWPRLLGIF